MDRQEGQTEFRPYELTHIGHFDIVSNNSADQEKVMRLITMIKNSLQENPNNPLGEWEQYKDGDEIRYLDNKQQPRYFGKRKWLVKDKFREYIRPTGGKNNRWVQVHNSLLNEFSISNEVKRIVSEPHTQEIIRQMGFRSFKFIEPLVGFINRETGDKTVIYEYVEGTPGLARPDGGTDTEFAERIIGKLKNIFSGNGLQPLDLRESQFLMKQTEGGADLFLIDVESYYK